MRENTTGKRILWIEDDAGNLRGLIRPIEKDGHRITIALNEEQALEALDSGSFDLIILDLIIPSASPIDWSLNELQPALVGVRLAEEIVKKRAINVPIIVISVVDNSKIKKCLLEMGIKKFLLKGHVLPSELYKEIKEILNI